MTNLPKYIIEKFNKKAHDRNGFNCGVKELNDYLQKQIRQDISKAATAAYIIREKNSDKISGFYTLSATSIILDEIEESIKKNLARYESIPAVLVGRLAVDKSHQGNRLGEKLLLNALERSLSLSKQIGVSAVIVEAKNNNAVKFYQNYEFLQFSSVKHKLYLPIKTISELFK